MILRSLTLFILSCFINFSVQNNQETSTVTCYVSLENFLEQEKITSDNFIVDCSCKHYISALCTVSGNSSYTTSSSLCCAGIHDGIISLNQNSTKMMVVVHNERKKGFVSTRRNGIKSRGSSLLLPYFTLTKLVKATKPITATKSTKTVMDTKPMTKSIPLSKHNVTRTAIAKTTTSNTNLKGQKAVQQIAFQMKTTTSDDVIHNNGKIAELTTKTLITSKHESSQHPFLIIKSQNPALSQLSSIQATVNQQETNLTTKNPVVSSYYQVVVGFLSTGFALVLIILIIYIAYQRRALNFRWIRLPRFQRHRDLEPCVCYVGGGIEQSAQNLLNDAETCTRSCTVRETADKIVDLSESCEGANDCNECASKYAF